MAKITVIGGGYVGLVTSACFAELGHEVRCLEADPEKVVQLRSGSMPIQEPGLTEMWQRHTSAGRLQVTDDPTRALFLTNFIFIAVGTPESSDGSANLSFVDTAIRTAVSHSELSRTICVKSTVPPGTCADLQRKLTEDTDADEGWTVVSNPEFLSQGRAIKDFMNPDRIVVGSSNPGVSEMVGSLYSSLGAPVVNVDSTASEMVKYAANSFLALKISFINEISRLCEHSGTDVGQVATGVGLDSRIGSRFLEAGIGWGGSCFPKDTAALEHLMQSAGVDSPIVSAARTVNTNQVSHIADQLQQMLGPTADQEVAVLGLTFKDGTDDMRGSQVVPLIENLISYGFHVRVFDPVKPRLPESLASAVTVCESPQEAMFGASGTILATAWPELVSLDYAAAAEMMRNKVLIDARRALDPENMRRIGFRYYRPGDGRIARSVVQQSTRINPLIAA